LSGGPGCRFLLYKLKLCVSACILVKPFNYNISKLKVYTCRHFYRAMLCISAVYAVMRCPSVCLSVTFVDHVKTNKHNLRNFSPSGSHTIPVFPYQTGWRYYDWNPPNGDVECRWGIGRNRDFGLIAGYRRLLDVQSAKNIYRRRS